MAESGKPAMKPDRKTCNRIIERGIQLGELQVGAGTPACTHVRVATLPLTCLCLGVDGGAFTPSSCARLLSAAAVAPPPPPPGPL